MYVTALPDGSRAASLVYDGPILVQTFRAQASPFIEKTIGTGSKAERLDIDGATAFWITGSHGFAYQSPAAVRVRGAADRREHAARRARATGSCCGSRARSRDRAVAIARSVQ